MNLLAHIEIYASHHELAYQYAQECLCCSRENKNQFGTVASMFQLSFTLIRLGDLLEAENMFRELLSLLNQFGTISSKPQKVGKESGLLFNSVGPLLRARPLLVSMDGDGLGWVANRTGHFAEAYQIIEKSLTLNKKMDNQQLTGSLTADLGFIQLNLGRYKEGRDLAELALSMLQERNLQDTFEIDWASQVLGIAHLALGNYAQAKRRLNAAIYLGSDEKDSGVLAYLGRVELALGDLPAAQRLLFHALQIGLEKKEYVALVESLSFIAQVLAETGNFELALEIYALAFEQPMIGRSQLFADISNRQIDKATQSIPAKTAEAALERGRSANLWQRTADLPAELNGLGWI